MPSYRGVSQAARGPSGGGGGIPDWVNYDPGWLVGGSAANGYGYGAYLVQPNPAYGQYVVDVQVYLRSGSGGPGAGQWWVDLLPLLAATGGAYGYAWNGIAVGTLVMKDYSTGLISTGAVHALTSGGLLFCSSGDPVDATHPFTWGQYDEAWLSLRYRATSE